MKKFGFLFLLLILIILVSCTKEPEQKVEKKIIDNEIVQKVVGSWKDDSYDYGDYIISVEDKTIHFNSEILTVDYTEDNEIYTHLEDDDGFHYHFVIEKDQIMVYPTYEIKQTSDEPVAGGALAPITLKKNPEISTTNILGIWKSTESDYPAVIQINATFNANQVELTIQKDENSTDSQPILLTLDSKDSSTLNFLNEDKTLNYTFSNYESTKLILGTNTTRKDATGESRPYILERSH